jgi:hypothetical protein
MVVTIEVDTNKETQESVRDCANLAVDLFAERVEDSRQKVFKRLGRVCYDSSALRAYAVTEHYVPSRSGYIPRVFTLEIKISSTRAKLCYCEGELSFIQSEIAPV